MSWFGIRGVGSFYYLMLRARARADERRRAAVPLVIAVITASVIVHGITADAAHEVVSARAPG